MTTPTAYELVWRGLGEKTREHVIVEVVEAQNRLAPEPRRRLLQALDVIKLNGFRNARRASLNHLRRISRCSNFKSKTAIIPGGFLFAWCSLRSSLIECLREEALRRGYTKGEGGAEDLTRLADVAEEQWKSLVDHGAEKFGGTPSDVVEVGLLMLRHELLPMATATQVAMAHERQPQSDSPGTVAVLLPPWSQMLDEASALASDAPAWSQLGDYLDRLQRLGAEKQAGQKERDRQVQRWGAFLVRVRAGAKSLAFVEVAHELSESPPTADRCPDWGVLADAIEQDLDILDSAVTEQPRVLSEIELYKEKLRQLAERLGANFSKLSVALGQVAVPQPAGAPIPTIEPVPSAKIKSVPSAMPAIEPRLDSVDATVLERANVEPSGELPEDDLRSLLSSVPGPNEVDSGQLSAHSEPNRESQPADPASESGVASHSDPVFAESSAASMEVMGPLELQPIWLSRGQLVRAMLAADLLEEVNGTGAALPVTFIPSWMCHLAARCNDRKAQLLGLDVGPFVGHLNKLAAESVPRQRFITSWLAAALLSQGAVPAMQCCEQMRPDLWKADWWDQHDLLRFCRDQILQPASHGQLLELDTLESVSSLERSFKKELEDARQITRMAHSYKNSFVKRVWTQMVAVDGPVLGLIADTERGVVVPVPTAHEVAEQVDGWGDVVSSYRNNVISRLEKCLGHLSAARSFNERLKRRASTKARSLNVEQAKTALGAMKKLFMVLEAESCPSLGGFRAVHEHLSRWTMSVGGRQ